MKLIAFQYGKTELAENIIFRNFKSDAKKTISLLFFLLETEDKKLLIDVGCDTMPGFPIFEFENPTVLLEKNEISPDDITDIFITHSHHDHIDCLRHFKNAVIYIQEKEYESGKKYFVNGNKVVSFEEQYRFNDFVTFKKIAGHTYGSSIAIIENDGEKYVLCGDECYSILNFERKIPNGSIINLENNENFIKNYRFGFNKIIFHDKDLVGEIGTKVIF
ncbi:MAG: MBL fold metallo-hydrolase [Ruminococcaceae bacterium]|nr:MBL fold metallo-hydrolase [Oscillospiraceae bacterium]